VSVEAALQTYETTWGPFIQARLQLVPHGRWPALRAELAAVLVQRNTSDEADLVYSSEYLTVMGGGPPSPYQPRIGVSEGVLRRMSRLTAVGPNRAARKAGVTDESCMSRTTATPGRPYWSGPGKSRTGYPQFATTVRCGQVPEAMWAARM
jgi:hypothetical protein